MYIVWFELLDETWWPLLTRTLNLWHSRSYRVVDRLNNNRWWLRIPQFINKVFQFKALRTIWMPNLQYNILLDLFPFQLQFLLELFKFPFFKQISLFQFLSLFYAGFLLFEVLLLSFVIFWNHPFPLIFHVLLKLQLIV